MTTIAATKTAMAADGRSTDDDIPSTCTKIVKLKDGTIIGWAGTYSEGLRFVEWYKNREMEKPPFDDTTALILKPDGTLEEWDSSLIAMPIRSEFWAIGSGRSVALGAMEMGATPFQAVQIAAKFDVGTGPPFKSFKISAKKA